MQNQLYYIITWAFQWKESSSDGLRRITPSYSFLMRLYCDTVCQLGTAICLKPGKTNVVCPSPSSPAHPTDNTCIWPLPANQRQCIKRPLSHRVTANVHSYPTVGEKDFSSFAPGPGRPNNKHLLSPIYTYLLGIVHSKLKTTAMK